MKSVKYKKRKITHILKGIRIGTYWNVEIEKNYHIPTTTYFKSSAYLFLCIFYIFGITLYIHFWCLITFYKFPHYISHNFIVTIEQFLIIWIEPFSMVEIKTRHSFVLLQFKLFEESNIIDKGMRYDKGATFRNSTATSVGVWSKPNSRHYLVIAILSLAIG